MDPKYKWGQKVKIAGVEENTDEKELVESLIGEEGTIADIMTAEGEFIYNLKSNNPEVENFYWCESELESAE